MDTAIELVRNIFASELNLTVSELSDDKFVTTLGLDSLTLMEIIVRIEQRLGCQIDAKKLVTVQLKDVTVGNIIRTLLDLRVAVGT